MSDPYTTLKPGDKGTVNFVDDTATVFVDWDNGSTLGVVYGEDVIKKAETTNDKIISQILKLRTLPNCPNMFDTVAVQRLAYEQGFYETVNFIEADRKAYANFILAGKMK